ncbi:hypothetical protein J3F84DRAFT_356015 [Trichoderma pleuroticola]
MAGLRFVRVRVHAMPRGVQGQKKSDLLGYERLQPQSLDVLFLFLFLLLYAWMHVCVYACLQCALLFSFCLFAWGCRQKTAGTVLYGVL